MGYSQHTNPRFLLQYVLTYFIIYHILSLFIFMLNVKQLHKTSHKNRKTQITDKLKARQTRTIGQERYFQHLLLNHAYIKQTNLQYDILRSWCRWMHSHLPYYSVHLASMYKQYANCIWEFMILPSPISFQYTKCTHPHLNSQGLTQRLTVSHWEI